MRRHQLVERNAPSQTTNPAVHHTTLDALTRMGLARHKGHGWYGLTSRGQSLSETPPRPSKPREATHTLADVIGLALIAWGCAMQGDSNGALRHITMARRHYAKIA